jgi:hypothetical protein
LAGAEGFPDFLDFCSLQVADFKGNFFDFGADERQCQEQFGVVVALDHLSGNGGGTEAKSGADPGFNLWVKVGKSADSSGQFAHGDGMTGLLEAAPVALQIGVVQGQNESKGGWFGVDAVGASDHDRVAVFVGAGFDGFGKGVKATQEQIAGIAHEDSVGGIHDIGGGQPEVEVAGRRANLLGEGGCKSDDVVASSLFDFSNARDGKPCFGADLSVGFGWDKTHFGLDFTHGEFDG